MSIYYYFIFFSSDKCEALNNYFTSCFNNSTSSLLPPASSINSLHLKFLFSPEEVYKLILKAPSDSACGSERSQLECYIKLLPLSLFCSLSFLILHYPPVLSHLIGKTHWLFQFPNPTLHLLALQVIALFHYFPLSVKSLKDMSLISSMTFVVPVTSYLIVSLVFVQAFLQNLLFSPLSILGPPLLTKETQSVLFSLI